MESGKPTRRHAYGYQRTEHDFAHVQGIDCFWFDGKKTERQERWSMLQPGAMREGDTVILLTKADLGSVGERKQIEAVITERGATLEVHEPPRGALRPGPKPRLSGLPELVLVRCARLWHDLTVPGPYAHKRIQDMAGWGVTRNQINSFFGTRSGPSDRSRELLNSTSR